MKWLRSLLRLIIKNRWMFRLIGVFLFIYVVSRIDLQEALETLSQVNLGYVFLSFFLQIFATIIATQRWQIIMRNFDIHIPFSRTLIFQFVGTSAALLTPGQLGEFVKALYQRNEGYPITDSLLSVAIDRLFDLFILLVLGFVSFAVLFGLQPGLVIALTLIGMTVILFVIFFFRNNETSSKVIANVLQRMSPREYRDIVRRDAHRLTRQIGELDGRFFLAAGFYSIANYLLLLGRIYAILIALHLVVPIWYFVMVVPILRLVGLVPISVLGIGTRDVTSIYLYGQVGIPASSALLTSTLGLLLLQAQIILGLIVSWRFPLLKEEKGDKIEPFDHPADAGTATESSTPQKTDFVSEAIEHDH